MPQKKVENTRKEAMKVNELNTTTIKDTLKMLVNLERLNEPHCQQHCTNDDCPTPTKQALDEIETMSNTSRWEEETSDPDFSWKEYCADLQEELLEVSNKYPLHEKVIKDFASSLDQIEESEVYPEEIIEYRNKSEEERENDYQHLRTIKAQALNKKPEEVNVNFNDYLLYHKTQKQKI